MNKLPGSSHFQHHLLIGASLLLLTFGSFWQVLNNEFVDYDDGVYVTKNPPVKDGLTVEGLQWAFTATHSGNWIPLTWISHMLDCQLFGLNPRWHHLTSLLFHLANTVLLFVALTKMTGEPWPSGFAAALFGIHPTRVESVAWAAERKDVLSTFFWMLALLAYCRYARQPGFGRYLLVFLLLALGLMAKPMLVTLPFVLLLLDYWPLGRMRSGRGKNGNQTWSGLSLFREKLPLFVLVLVSSAISLFAQRSQGAVESLERLPLWARAGNALISYAKYVGNALWPSNLSVLYPHPGRNLPLWQIVTSLLVLACVTWMVIRMASRRPSLAIGWLWYLGTLVPVIGLVQIGTQAMADRYTYVPLIGLFIIIAWGVPDFLAGWSQRKWLVPVAALATIAVLAVVTWSQVKVWRNNFTLFAQAVRAAPDSPVAHNTLGSEFLTRGRTEEALLHLSQAVNLNPNYAKAQFNLGLVLSQQGKTGQAIGHYLKALQADPKYAKAHLNLGVALAQRGEFNEAFDHYLQALETQPDYPEAHVNLGIELLRQQKVRQAMDHFSQAISLRPDFAHAHYNLGKSYLYLKNRQGAVREYEILRSLDARLANNLAGMMNSP